MKRLGSVGGRVSSNERKVAAGCCCYTQAVRCASGLCMLLSFRNWQASDHQLLLPFNFRQPLASTMHRFHIKRKISDTLLGATYECERVREASSSNVKPTYTSSVAVKCCSLTIAEDATVPEDRLIDHPRREQQVVSKLIASGGHRNVLQCYDHFVADDIVYFVSEFCAGGDLYHHLSTFPNGTMDEATAVHTLAQIADGVVYLHSLGFAHRDLSLENVLLRH